MARAFFGWIGGRRADANRVSVSRNRDGTTAVTIGASSAMHPYAECLEYGLKDPNFAAILGYLGLSLTHSDDRRKAVFRYVDPRRIAERLRHLNAILPAEHQMINLYVYDGHGLPTREYLNRLRQDSLPVASGVEPPNRPAGSKESALDVSSHDFLLHFPVYVAADPKVRSVLGRHIGRVLAMPDEPTVPPYSEPDDPMITPVASLARTVDSYRAALPNYSDARDTGPASYRLSGALLALNYVPGAELIDLQTANTMQRESRAHLAVVASFI